MRSVQIIQSNKKKYMKKSIFLIFFMMVFLCQKSYAEDWKNPYSLFDAKQLISDNVSIKWIRVSDIRATCEAESRKRGLGGFGYSMEACSFWGTGKDGKSFCDVFTRVKTTLHDIGHEMRHCFQGSFH